MKFVEFTNYRDNTKMFVSAERISLMSEQDSSAYILLESELIKIKETYEGAKDIIEDALWGS